MNPRPPYLFPVGAQIRDANAVLHARAKQQRVSNHTEPLSIKTVLSGPVVWIVGGHKLTLLGGR